MKPDDLQKLLGGYAAGTLTPREREELFRGALEDQALFDALVKEDALRDLLSDRAARAELLAALEERRGLLAWFGWLRRPAAALATTGALAVAVLVLVTVPRPTGRVELAKVEIPAPLGTQQEVRVPSSLSPPPEDEGAAGKRGEPPREVRSRAMTTPPSPPRERDAAPRFPSVSGRAEPPEQELAGAREPALPEPNRDRPGAPLAEGPRAAAVGVQDSARWEAETRREALMVSQRTPPPAPASPAPGAAGGPAAGQTPPAAVGKAPSGVTLAGELTEPRDASERFQTRAAAGAEAVPMKEQLARKKAEPVSWRILAVSGDTVTIEPLPDRPLAVGARLGVWRGVTRIGELTVSRIAASGVEARFTGSSRPRPGDFARPLEPAGSGYNRR